MSRFQLFLMICLMTTLAALGAEKAAANPTSWAGFYAGIHIGGGAANYNGRFDSNEALLSDQGFPEDLDLDGIVGGIHIGHNWQWQKFVLGIEADITATNFEDTVRERDGGPADFMNGEVNFIGSVRARAGLVVSDQVLVYGTAGLAFIDAEYTAINGPINSADRGSVDFDDVGYVVGGGAEAEIAKNLLVRVEGLYYGFDDSINTSTLTGDSDPADFAELENLWAIRAGLSFKLN